MNKYYKNTTGEIYAFVADGSQDAYITGDMVRLTEAEEYAHTHQEASPEQVANTITAQVQERLDAFARTRRYDGILSACSYATSTREPFLSEGQRAVDLRDATWLALYAFMADAQAGKAPMPTGIADVEHLLPTLEWPQ